MSGKVMVVSYNAIKGVFHGRTECGNAIAYSGSWELEHFADAIIVASFAGNFPLFSEAAQKQCRAATDSLASLEQSLAEDLPAVETVYVYVGYSAMKSALAFIRKLQDLGKTVRMIACDCDRATKLKFAAELGIEIIWSECGGREKCREIFAEHAVLPTTV